VAVAPVRGPGTHQPRDWGLK